MTRTIRGPSGGHFERLDLSEELSRALASCEELLDIEPGAALLCIAEARVLARALRGALPGLWCGDCGAPQALAEQARLCRCEGCDDCGGSPACATSAAREAHRSRSCSPKYGA